MASESRHTDGPWTGSIVTTKAGRNKIAISGNGGRTGHRRLFDMSILDEEDSANADLVIAAPDMLAALKAMVAAYREGCADQDEPGMVKDALAAIAKAEGR